MPGVPSDFDLTSFDGTTIRIHWFPDPSADGGARPTVLMGPGWGESGDTDTSQVGIQGALSIAQLWQGGFNVLTWDPRGFGHSSGAAEVDSPSDEGRDVSAMINWVAQQYGVELDRPGVPRIGMVGESYGGGIQFAAAEQDCRIDAIAPTIAWHSLGTSLDKNQTPKSGWGNILASVSATAKLDPEITASDHEMDTTGVIDARAVSFFESRGPAQFLSHVKVPTLILQGTVDDLFTLDEGIENYEALRQQGTTVSMAWFCGGHGVCLTDPGTAIEVGPLSLAWMQRYVARDPSVHVLKGFEFVDQNGTSYAAPGYPLPAGAPIVATGTGSLALEAGGGSGPPTVAANVEAANIVDSVAYGVTPGPAANAPEHQCSHHTCGGRRRSTDAVVDLLRHRAARHAPHPCVRPAGRPRDRDRPQQPGHSRSGDARWQIPQPDDPTRNRRLHHEGGWFARAATGRNDCRLRHPENRWHD